MYPQTATNTGFETLMGVSVESAEGVAAKSVRLLERQSGTMTPKFTKLQRDVIRNHPGVAGHVNGVSEVNGKPVLEITPEGLSEMLCAVAGAPTSEAVAPPATPTGLAVANVGAAGAVTAAYKVIACSPQGDSAASGTVSTTTGNAVLNGTNYNRLTWDPVQGALFYKILKAGALLATNIVGLSYNDQGAATVAYVAPDAATGYKHTWRMGKDQLSVTIAELIAGIYQVTAGVKAKSLGIKFDKTATKPVTAEFDLEGLWVNRGLTDSQCGLDTAGNDPLPAYGVAPSAVCFIDGLMASAQNADYTFDRNIEKKHVLTGKTAPHSHYLQGAQHKQQLKLYFDDETQMASYFGHVSTPVGVYGQVDKVIYHTIETVMTLPTNQAGVVNQFGVYTPHATFMTIGAPVEGKAAIMQDIEVEPAIDPATGDDVLIYIVNSQTNANIVTPGATITGVDGGAMYPYSA